MEPHKHSTTALVAALVRAHHRDDASTPIFDDPHAHRLLTATEREFIETKWFESMGHRGRELLASYDDRAEAIRTALRELPFPAVMLARARFAEDQLELALRAGVRQYVLLGAGLDTFVWRRPDLLDSIEVIEIDHSATQAFKLRRLADSGFEMPSNVHFVAADLERESVEQALSRSTYRSDVRTLFAWLGVTMYLTSEAIARTLHSIALASCAESQLVFDYLDTDAFDPAIATQRIQQMMAAVASLGEPLVTGFDPTELSTELDAAGFQLIENLAPADQQARYFDQGSDGFYATEHFHLACAVRR